MVLSVTLLTVIPGYTFSITETVASLVIAEAALVVAVALEATAAVHGVPEVAIGTPFTVFTLSHILTWLITYPRLCTVTMTVTLTVRAVGKVPGVKGGGAGLCPLPRPLVLSLGPFPLQWSTSSPLLAFPETGSTSLVTPSTSRVRQAGTAGLVSLTKVWYGRVCIQWFYTVFIGSCPIHALGIRK